MTPTDLVVVLPGIMGSTLARDGKLVWGPSAGAVRRSIRLFGQCCSALTLPDGLGDDHPDDLVDPVGLMPDLHVLPGVWTPIKGYDLLLQRLRNLGYRESTVEAPGNLLPVPYDWRLSNRYNGRRLKSIVELALERWRSSSRRNQDAQLVFVCHSMGGLVARWYVEMCGGAGHTRKIVTLGTPYRGAAKAAVQLVNGVERRIGPIGVRLTDFARSLPSLYQLLPGYAFVAVGGELRTASEQALPRLVPERVADAAAFQNDLAAAEATRSASVNCSHMIIGIKQPTTTSVRIDGETVEALETIGDDNDFGDGTVPVTGSIGHELPMDTPMVHGFADRHGHLQCNAGVLDEVERAVTAKNFRRRAGATVPLRVSVPELLLVDELLRIEVEIGGDGRHGVQISVVDERGVAISRAPRPRGGHVEADFGALAPGAYDVTITGLSAGSPIAPVVATVLVWG